MRITIKCNTSIDIILNIALPPFLIFYFNRENNIVPWKLLSPRRCRLTFEALDKSTFALPNTCNETVVNFKEMNEKRSFTCFERNSTGNKFVHLIKLLTVLNTMWGLMQWWLSIKTKMECVFWWNLNCIDFSATAPRLVILSFTTTKYVVLSGIVECIFIKIRSYASLGLWGSSLQFLARNYCKPTSSAPILTPGLSFLSVPVLTLPVSSVA